MGSRRKKLKSVPEKESLRFFQWYRNLVIHEKIAVKQFVYEYGRGRVTLQEMLSSPYYYKLGPLARKNMVIDGYTWL